MGTKSMTGFAVSNGEADGIDWRWDIRSVNGRGLDMRVRLPQGFEDAEPAIVEDAEPEPIEDPQPESGAATAPPADVTLAEFSAAWPAIVAKVRDQFGARRHAFVKVAEPVSVEDGVAILTLPTHQHFHLEQLNADTELQTALKAIAAEILGGSIRLEFRAGDGEAASTEPERAPDKDRLSEGDGPEDPADLIVDMLGGEVVSE